MKKKLLALLLAMVMIVGLLPGAAWAAETVTEISTDGEFATMEEAGNYKLMADITVIAPYGSSSTPFTGTFDGNGHTVTLSIDSSGAWQGLFAYNKGIIKNLVTTGFVIGGNNTGAIAAKNEGVIESCGNTATVSSGGTSTSTQCVGGIAGYTSGSNSRISSCYNSGSVTGGKKVGGLTGQLEKGTITNCYNTGTVKYKATASTATGGIAGYVNSGASISSSYTTGSVTYDTSLSSVQVGAFAGYLTTGLSLTNNYCLSGAYSTPIGVNNGYTVNEVLTAALKDLSGTLGATVWISDKNYINSGYPILAWQAKTGSVKVSVVSVSIDGTARSGKNLTAQAKGAGDTAATGVKYQWQIGDSASGSFSDISGATGQGFALADAHVGKLLRVSVTGDENSSSVSDAAGPVLISETAAVASSKADLGGIPAVIRANTTLTLAASGANGCTITWDSDKPQIINNDGSVTLPETDNITVTLTATIACGGASDTKKFDILVYPKKAMEGESVDPAVYLENAVASLRWYHLKPVYGIDTNVNAVLKAALTKNGYGDLTVSVESVENSADKRAAVAENGDITYYYSDPNSLGGPKVNSITVTFKLTKGGAAKVYSSNAVIGWNLDKVKTYLNTEIFSSISLPTEAGGNFDLPKYIGGKGGKTWVKLSYSVSDESALTISDEKQSGSADNIYNPYVGKIKTLPTDKSVTLTVTVEFNYSQPAIEMSKTYPITVKGNPAAAEALRKELSDKLERGFASKGLTDYVTGAKLMETDGVYTASNDIKLPTTKDFGVDGKYYPVTLKSSDTDVLVTPNVNNASRVYTYRPLPGKSAKTATLTVSLTDKSTGISASKEFKISVSPLTQGEIDAEIALMTQTKAHYFDGIRNANTSAKSITSDLHAFQEAYLKDGSLTWVYDSKELENHGIVPVAMDGWETLEQWRAFRSSNVTVISHENMLVTRQTESKAVTVTGYLSSEVYGKYAEKYRENADFQKLYYQPVTANLIVTGTAPTSSKPVAEKLTVSFTLQNSKSTWIVKTDITDLPEGSTVFDVFTKALRDSGYNYSSRGSYVYAITTPNGTILQELDEGANSGWMYKVNGVIPSSYMAACPLKNGDNVVVFFTKDYTLEQWSTPTETTNFSGRLAPTVTALNGKAQATIGAEGIKNALSQNNGRVVIAPKITGSAESVSVSVPVSSVKEIAENASGALSVESDCGSVSIPNGTLDSVSAQAGGSDIKMTIETKSAKDVNLPASDLEKAAIVEISISSGGKKITTFGGNSLGVSIPVTGNYKTGDTYKVIVISADGTVETLVGKVVTNNGKASVEVTVKHLSTFVVTNTPVSIFDDVNTDAWYYDAVQYASQKGIMKGAGETSFSPNAEVSRAMLTTVLYRLAGAPAVSGENSFSDVAKGEWYYDAVVWASKNGIVNGRGDGSFGTDENVTREEAATILYRYAQFKKLDVSKTEELSKYGDASSVSSWAQNAVKWANAVGFIKGTTAVTLSPNGSMTRAQAATVFMRFCKNAEK